MGRIASGEPTALNGIFLLVTFFFASPITRRVSSRTATFLALLLSTGATLLGQADGAQRWPFATLSTSTTGNILSSPAAGPDGRIYIGVQVGAAASAAPSGRLYAVQSNGTGILLFTAPDWIDSTPAIADDGTIYVGCWNGVLYAMRPDGTKRWELKLGPFIASSPAIGADGTIYVGAGSDVCAVSPEGVLKWSFPAIDWIDSSPAVAPDGTIVVGSWDANVYALNPDGTEKWRFATGDNASSSPAIAADGTIYIGSRDLKIYALSAAGGLKWSFDTGDTVDASPVIGADGTVYVASTGGRMFALNRTGGEVWRYPRADQPALNAIYSSAAVRADGSIVFGSSNDALYALRADGTLLWRTPMGDWSDSSPLVTSDSIYIGASDKRLYAFVNNHGVVATDWPQFRRDPRRQAWTPIGATSGTSGRLVNLSVRTFAGSNDNTLIVGFFVGGSGTRSLLVRGVGPTLTAFGVSGQLADPQITMYSGNALPASNDNWSASLNAGAIASTAAAVGGFPLPVNSLDAALFDSFSTGLYTVHVSGANGATGTALMEVYDAGGSSGARLVNVSARSTVSAGDGVLIAGFVVSDRTRAMLVRGIGPSLTGFGVTGALANPQLRIFKGSQVIAENDDWSVASGAIAVADAAQSVQAFPLSTGSRDAALLLTLAPGAYTVQVSGVGGTAGAALIEVYEVP